MYASIAAYAPSTSSIPFKQVIYPWKFQKGLVTSPEVYVQSVALVVGIGVFNFPFGIQKFLFFLQSNNEVA